MVPATFRIDGWRLEVREIQPEDRALWLDLMRTMSWATRFKRGARRVDQLSAADVEHAVNPHAESELAFVAIAERNGDRKMSGVARATRRAAEAWEFTLVVLDEWQRRGVGGRLMQALIEAVRARGGQSIEGEVLSSNLNMLDFVRNLGFETRPGTERVPVQKVVLRLVP